MSTGVKRAGFTVIEVMLFFAASAVLAAAIFGTSMLNINNQRYTDAVRSFKALVQEQYVNTNRVQNPNDAGSQCPGAGSARDRGTNDCLVVGKFFSVTNGDTIVIRNIVGVPPAQENYNGSTDITAIQQMQNLYAVNAGTEKVSPQWNTTVQARHGASFGILTFSIAIVRSPATGTPYTFFISGNGSDFQPADESSVGEDLKPFIIDTTSNLLSNELAICVQPQGLAPDTSLQQISINGKISSPSGVEQKDSTGC